MPSKLHALVKDLGRFVADRWKCVLSCSRSCFGFSALLIRSPSNYRLLLQGLHHLSSAKFSRPEAGYPPQHPEDTLHSNRDTYHNSPAVHSSREVPCSRLLIPPDRLIVREFKACLFSTEHNADKYELCGQEKREHNAELHLRVLWSCPRASANCRRLATLSTRSAPTPSSHWVQAATCSSLPGLNHSHRHASIRPLPKRHFSSLSRL